MTDTLFDASLRALPRHILSCSLDVRRYSLCCGSNWLDFSSNVGCLVAEHGNVRRLESFIQTGARPSRDGLGDTLLHKACRSKNQCVEKIYMLLNYDETWLNSQNRNGVAPIHIAATKKCTDALKLLTSQIDCDVNVRSRKRLTALHIAAHGGLIENVNELLSHPQIDCNAMDVNGDTAAHHAAARGL